MELPLRNQLNLARPCRTDLLLETSRPQDLHSPPFSSYKGFRVTGIALENSWGFA